MTSHENVTHANYNEVDDKMGNRGCLESLRALLCNCCTKPENKHKGPFQTKYVKYGNRLNSDDEDDEKELAEKKSMDANVDPAKNSGSTKQEQESSKRTPKEQQETSKTAQNNQQEVPRKLMEQREKASKTPMTQKDTLNPSLLMPQEVPVIRICSTHV